MQLELMEQLLKNDKDIRAIKKLIRDYHLDRESFSDRDDLFYYLMLIEDCVNNLYNDGLQSIVFQKAIKVIVEELNNQVKNWEDFNSQFILTKIVQEKEN